MGRAMDLIWGLVSLSGLLVALAGLISIIIPLRFLKIRSRGRGALVMICGLLVTALAGQNLPQPEPAPEAEETATADQAASTAAPAISEPAARALSPNDAQSIFVELGEVSGLITRVDVWIEDGDGVDALDTVAQIANSIPEPGLADSANVAVFVSQPYLPDTPDGNPSRHLAAQAWQRSPDGRTVWLGASFYEPVLGGDHLARERRFAAALADRGEDPISPDQSAADEALAEVRQAFGMSPDAWPLYAPSLTTLETDQAQDLVEEARRSDAWHDAIEAVLEPICRTNQACVYNANITEFERACRNAINDAVLTDTDWPFLSLPTDRFNRFGFADGQTHAMILAGDRLRIQNTFGTWVDAIYTCEVAIDSGVVLEVNVEPGRF